MLLLLYKDVPRLVNNYSCCDIKVWVARRERDLLLMILLVVFLSVATVLYDRSVVRSPDDFGLN